MIRLKVITALLAVVCGFSSAFAADRYWRGTTDDDWSTTANWSASSGGATGVSTPTSADRVFFDSGGDNPCTITGDQAALQLFIQNTYTSTVTMSSTSSLVVTNNLRLRGGTLSLSQGVIGSARRLDVNGNYQQTGGTMNQHNFFNLAGNFIKTGGTYNSFTSATLIFDGSVQQQLSSTGGLTVEYMQVNNTGEGLSVNNDLAVEISLDMVDGNINLNLNKLTIGIDATDVGDLTHTTGFISDGTVRRWFDGTSYTSTSDDQIRFPFGIESASDNSLWIGCSAPFTGGYIEASYEPGHDAFTAIAPTFVDNSVTVDRRNNTEWAITDRTIVADNDLLIFVRTIGISSIADITACRVSQANAVAPGAHGTGSGNDVSRTGIDETNLLSSFYLAGNSAVNKLPVSLSMFNASLRGTAVELLWETQSEINNEVFELERSVNGIDFEMIGATSGAGTSSDAITYTFMDVDALYMGTDKLFYRIKQVDFDGTTTYTTVRAVDLQGSTKVSWYPNPSENILRISTADGSAVIRSLDGREMIHSHNTDQIDVSALRPGMYIITFYDKQGTPMEQGQLVKK